MSLLDNIKGRSGDEGDQGGKFNPFRLLDIGEIMVRYTDGIRIKDFVFLAVLTSERLILIDSARQGTGQITKEIPFSVIKQAELERDERDRPSLAISMEVGGQQRIMRLVFTGLINEPESECREWYTAINGYPPERIEQPEINLSEPAPVPREEQVPVFTGTSETPAAQSAPAPHLPPTPPIRNEPEIVLPPPEPVSISQPPMQAPVPVSSPPEPVSIPQPPVQAPVPVSSPPEPVSIPQPPAPAPVPVSSPPEPVSIPQPSVQQATRITLAPIPVQTPTQKVTRKEESYIPVSEGSVRVMIEKPDISPLQVHPKPAGEGGSRGAKSFKYCIHCGARTPSHARFCQACGNTQT